MKRIMLILLVSAYVSLGVPADRDYAKAVAHALVAENEKYFFAMSKRYDYPVKGEAFNNLYAQLEVSLADWLLENAPLYRDRTAWQREGVITYLGMARQGLLSEGSSTEVLDKERERYEKLKKQLNEDAKTHEHELKDVTKKADDLAAQLRQLESASQGAGGSSAGANSGSHITTHSGDTRLFWQGTGVGFLGTILFGGIGFAIWRAKAGMTGPSKP
jgi:hypothetical protein